MHNRIDIITVRDTLSYIYVDMGGIDEFSEVRRSLKNAIRSIKRVDRSRHQRVQSTQSTGLMIMVFMGFMVGGYIVKSAAGIDLLPGASILHPVYAMLSNP